MGVIVLINCHSCEYEESFHIGRGFYSFMDDNHEYKKILNGAYGVTIKQALEKQPNLEVNIAWELYQCVGCFYTDSYMALDLLEKQRFGAHDKKTLERTVYEHKHLCPKCKKRMKKITFDPSRKIEGVVHCPQCHKEVRIVQCGYWD